MPILHHAEPGPVLADCIKAGWALVPTPEGRKGPTSKGWNTREGCVTTLEQLPRITGNVGLAHAYSGTACLDIDDLEATRQWFTDHGLDLDELLNDPLGIGISSGRENRAKRLYSLETPLPSVKLAGGAFELRCATRQGTTVQDLLPGSVVDGRTYTWAFDELLTDPLHPLKLPDALLELWKRLAEGPKLELVKSEPLPTPGFASTKLLLSQHDPDCSYNDWLKVGMALHHAHGAKDGLLLWDEWSAQGAKYKGLRDLEKHWRTFRSTHENPVTLASLRVEQVVTPDQFPDLTAESPAAKANRFTLLTVDELLTRPPLTWHVKGVIPRAGLAVIYGEPGAGKSFAAIDLATAIGSGSAWRDRRTAKGRVVYVVAEGQSGFRDRIDAARRHGMPVDGLSFITVPPNLLQAGDVRDLIASIGKADLIVIDTLAQAMPGANENASEDMGKALDHCRILHRETGATVVLVHHSGKDATKGARGWSGLKAAADAELEVSALGDARLLRVTKMKDGSDIGVFPFKLTAVHLDPDEDGDVRSSAVVEHVDTAPPRMRAEPRGGVQRLVLDTIRDLAGLDETGSVLVERVIEQVVAGLPRDASRARDTRRQSVRQALTGLVARNHVLICGGRAVLT